jgi:hypothetical protein
VITSEAYDLSILGTMFRELKYLMQIFFEVCPWASNVSAHGLAVYVCMVCVYTEPDNVNYMLYVLGVPFKAQYKFLFDKTTFLLPPFGNIRCFSFVK